MGFSISKFFGYGKDKDDDGYYDDGYYEDDKYKYKGFSFGIFKQKGKSKKKHKDDHVYHHHLHHGNDPHSGYEYNSGPPSGYDIHSGYGDPGGYEEHSGYGGVSGYGNGSPTYHKEECCPLVVDAQCLIVILLSIMFSTAFLARVINIELMNGRRRKRRSKDDFESWSKEGTMCGKLPLVVL